MRLIFCILGVQKSTSTMSQKRFYVGEWLRELIICHPDVLKNDFGGRFFKVSKGHATRFMRLGHSKK
jgi:hypothetical protein